MPRIPIKRRLSYFSVRKQCPTKSIYFPVSYWEPYVNILMIVLNIWTGRIVYRNYMRLPYLIETGSGMPFVLPNMKEILCAIYWVCISITIKISLNISTAKWYCIYWCLRSVIPILRSTPFLINSVTKTERLYSD